MSHKFKYTLEVEVEVLDREDSEISDLNKEFKQDLEEHCLDLQGDVADSLSEDYECFVKVKVLE